MVQLGNMGANADDWDLLNLLFLSSSRDVETVWLINTYVLYVWGDDSCQKTRSQVGQVLWVSDI